MKTARLFSQMPYSPRFATIILSILTFCCMPVCAQVSITIGSGATLEMSSGSQMFLSGNWTNNGTFIPGDSTVIFDGGGTQTISNASGETFYNLTINKSAGDLVISSDVAATNTLTMISGNVITGANILALGLTAEGTLVRTTGRVIGNFR